MQLLMVGPGDQEARASTTRDQHNGFKLVIPEYILVSAWSAPEGLTLGCVYFYVIPNRHMPQMITSL